MKVRLLGGRVWLAVLVLVLVYAGFGFGYASSSTVETHLFEIAACCELAAIVAFIGIYTWLGLFTSAMKWWRNELGTALVLAYAGAAPKTAVLVYIAFFHHDQLDQAVPDWIFNSGPLLTTAGLVWLSYVWLKEAR